jgi:hypothetical protein
MFTPCWAERTKTLCQGVKVKTITHNMTTSICLEIGKRKSNMQTQMLVFAHVLCIFKYDPCSAYMLDAINELNLPQDTTVCGSSCLLINPV